MLTNTERQQIVEEVNAGTYGIDEALDDIAAAQKGEEVRKALYAEALVLNREGHAGSTDMIARQQIANLQTSVNGQISTFRTEVGEDIDDLETALNSGLATQNGRIAAQNASIANVVANYNVEYGSTELWASTGETGALAAGTTVTLSEDVSHFDYVDIYSFCGNSNVLDTVPVDAKLQSNAGYALRWVNLSDPDSGSYKAYVRIIETRLHIIGTTLTIDHQVTYRNGEEVNISGAEITQSNRSTYMGELGIMKVVGRKITANTEIEDVRIGADGTEYASAGQAVRAQVQALESAIPAVDSTLSTQGAAADAKVAGDKVAELKSHLSDIIQATRNLWRNGEVSVEGSTGYNQFLLETPLEAGTYTLSCKCESSWTETNYSVIQFSNSQNSASMPGASFIADCQIIHDGTRRSATFTISETAYSVRFLSAKTVGNSSGQTSTWSDIQVESGNSSTAYINPTTANDLYAIRATGIIVTSANMPETYSDFDNLPVNKIIGVNASAIRAGMAHAPTAYGMEVFTLSHFQYTAVLQVAVPFNRMADTKIYIRSLVNHVWGDWQGIETNPLYVGYDLYPTGDTTDRNLEIIAVLSTKGVCRLAPGDFYCSVLAVYEGTEIIGCGNSTRIIRLDSSSYNYMIRLRKDCKLKDVSLLGSLTDITVADDWDLRGTPAGICAIRIEGTGSDDSQRFRAEISNVSISSFAGAGIFINKTGYNPQSGCHIEGVFVRNCNAGIVLGQYAEFHRITGCGFFECYYGTVNNGGNNVFENCDFSSNIQGLLMDNSSGTYSNSSHGSFVGCSFNHSDSNNGTAIELNTMVAGEMFVGCNIFYGAIILTSSQGIIFNSCNLGSSTPITITDGGGIQFANCVFRTGQSPVTDNRPTKTHFDNCYYLNGSAVNGVPA